MKKDKVKHRPNSEQTTAEEPKISSVTLTLQLLTKAKEKNKEAEKKESADETAKVRCKVCFKEIAPKRLCSGHGGGGGGGDSASSDKTSEENASQSEDRSLARPLNIVETTDGLIGEFGSEELDLESSFDPEIIAELIAKGLLLVDSDRASKTLTIKLLCEPQELTEEQSKELKKFMEAIIKEFNEFKEENILSDDCLQLIQDEEGNICSLSITMPTLALYDAFIQRLANNLVPIPSPKAQEKDEVTKARTLAPNPLSMEPKPYKPSKQEKTESNKDIEPKRTEEGEQEQVIFNPSPFNMKPW
ncbi:TPA: hypothetical protein JAN90_09900 [Legionella pneumophila]|nr:hypothetical protein [Legionella pneumophila]HAT8857946.1 hypothetical protein [Legionella pneumophila subsp. pneumophila]HAT7073063.1 hypothetical protein [Legionella pneumophila]HAT8641910.1 hypothetical protein [Legionella pneumophila]HAT8868081.1 hypothetical protein [Legionella pneumophila subsp. pneumophila]HAT8889830.1 hypothetical protein [Legionella pneumophila subsp. pneumophila]